MARKGEASKNRRRASGATSKTPKAHGGRNGKTAGPARKRVSGRKAPARRSRGDVPMMRNSERGSFKRCRWAWDMGYNHRIKPIEEMPALRFGSLVHKALEARYPKGKRRGPHPARAFEKVYAEELKEAEAFGFRDADGEWADALELGVDMLEHYVEHFGKDEEWEVIQSEMPFQQQVHAPCSGCAGRGRVVRKTAGGKKIRRTCSACDGSGKSAQVLFVVTGVIDGVWRNRMDASIRVNDYKTTKNDPTKVSHLALDDQCDTYWTYGVDFLREQGIIKPDQELAGMLYTLLRKAKKDTRPRNAEGQYLNKPKKDGTQEVSKKQPTPWFHRELVYRSEINRQRTREQVLAEFRDMQEARADPTRIYKNPGGAPPLNNCQFCGYRDICELHQSGADWEAMRDVTMREWDPYEEHEIYTAETRS